MRPEVLHGHAEAQVTETCTPEQARVEELLSSQAQAAAVPADPELQRQIATLEADLSAACTALAQARLFECSNVCDQARARPGPAPDRLVLY